MERERKRKYQRDSKQIAASRTDLRHDVPADPKSSTRSKRSPDTKGTARTLCRTDVYNAAAVERIARALADRGVQLHFKDKATTKQEQQDTDFSALGRWMDTDREKHKKVITLSQVQCSSA